MREFSICKTDFYNQYLVSSLGPYHIYLAPIIIYFIENEENANYRKNPLPKHLTLGKNEYKEEDIIYGLLAERDIPEPEKVSGTIHKEDIKHNLANLTNLVFEVTDACNLKCKYCGYGEFYTNYDVRQNSYMTFETAKAIIDYLILFWRSSLNHTLKRTVTFGFYGGEPLLNIELIKEIVDYIESHSPSTINYEFNMTTNGTMLDKYMDYLVLKKFRLLISLDGNETNHSYRVTHNGSNSFSLVCKNVKLVKQKYPDFFEQNVSFNAVLHNRNSVKDIITFINEEFGKNPQISGLSDSGINPNKLEEFNKTYKNFMEDIDQSDILDQLTLKNGFVDPIFAGAVTYVNQHTGNFFKSYKDLLLNQKKNLIPTATCLPFAKKMFVTVSGKILPCERIGQQFYLGVINKSTVELDFENIALKYNKYYNNLQNQCGHCYGYLSCMHCIFNIDTLQQKNNCPFQKSYEEQDLYVSSILSFFEKNPEAYKKSMSVKIE
jgi:uncharacterized protein